MTAETREKRRQHLGASEIAAVCGLDDFRSPIDVWLEKRGLAPVWDGNEFTEWGHRFEDAIAQKYAELFGATIRRTKTQISPYHDWMSASPDRYVELEGGSLRGLEVKNKDSRQLIHFGEEGTDQVPDSIAMQCHWSMMVTGIREWDVAVLFGGHHFRHYRIQQDDALAKMLFDQGRSFWFDNVLAGVEPQIDGSDSWAKRLLETYAQRTAIVRPATAEEDLQIAELVSARSEIAELEGVEALLKNQLKNAIGPDSGILSKHARVTWNAPKDSILVDYESIAMRYLKQLTDEDRAAVLAGYTTTRKNARRFLITLPKAGK